MSVHWLVSLTRRSVFPGVDDVAIPPGASHTEAWRILAEATGRPQEELAATIARVFRTEVADFASAEPTATKLLPGSIAVETGVFPLTYRDRYLTVATSNPTDVAAEQEIAFASGRKPRFHIAPPGTLHQHIHAAYRLDKAAEALLTTVDAHMATMVEIVEEEGPESLPAEESATGPVVRLTNVILHEAIHRNASDIHIQPKGAGGIVRYRVDGVLQEGMELPLPVLTRVVSRIKVMSQLDITDRLRPQDGRARISVDGRKYDLRVSTVPTRVAEKAVIRVLDSQGAGTLDDSGIPAEELVRIRRALANRDGIFVVTGPTGSGKTTTLYGALRELSTDDVNIMTVEDPVEYELPGLTQIQVESKQGMTFGSALRAILRQDPDIIFVGEIRDAETAHIAAQASLTGHLVLATLHTNDAVGAIRRFIDLGLDPTTVSETLRGTIAQRLVRRLCDQCVQPVGNDPTPEEIELSKRFHVRPGNRAVGCEACRGQGYRGRLPVVEFLAPSTAFQRLVQQDASPLDILEQATRDGMRTLVESALDRVRSGETSLDEVARVIGEVAEGAEGWMGSAPQRH
ncbi:MAG: GspE/PulE family protein, partial [Gemmatimonadota bacterium]|nr:GspE/PulE family protein [Gemmatimonadota bacterium]